MSTKQFKNEKIIAETIVDIRGQRQDLEKLAADHFEYAVEATQLGQDDYATELLETCVELEDFVENLRYLEIKVKTTAVTSKALGKLTELPKALDACRRVFRKGPDFKTLGKDFGSLLGSLKTSRDQFKELRKALTSSKDPVYAEVFGESKKTADPKYEQRLTEKKKALEARLVSVTAQTPAPTAVSKAIPCEDVASVDAIAKMLDEERRG